ncbi:MAG: 50S ribosomal protein L21 [Dichotomicrobium sp.]
MYAVIRTGGKQYRVAPDQEVQIEKIDAAEGERIEFDDVLMIGKDGGDVQVGSPRVDGARVSAEVLEQGRGDKIVVFKKKRRKNYRRKNGHRQHLTTIRVLEVLGAGDKAEKKPGESTGKKAEPGEGMGAAAAKGTKAKAESGKSGAKSAKAESDKGKSKASAKAKAAGFEKLDAPQGEADDLKKLPGVGPKLAEKLNDYGIFHFHQLAAMSESDVEEMDSALELKGRASRDDWVGQARQMLE